MLASIAFLAMLSMDALHGYSDSAAIRLAKDAGGEQLIDAGHDIVECEHVVANTSDDVSISANFGICRDAISMMAISHLRSAFELAPEVRVIAKHIASFQPTSGHIRQLRAIGSFPEKLSKRMRVDVAVVVSDRRREIIPVWITVLAKRVGLVSKKLVRSGEHIEQADVLIETIDAFSPNCALVAIDDIGGTRAVKPIERGQAICSDSIEKIPDVERGASMSMKYVDQSLLLEVPVVAIESGFIGRPILVEIVPTGARLVAVVVETGVVHYEK
jgi:flagella basal body P-ring formation protein FlgA